VDWTSDAAKLLISQGLLGLAVLVLGAVVFFLWRALEAKDTKLIETLTAWREDTKSTGLAMAALLDKTTIIAEALRDKGSRR
jgi:hypothetical protein